MNIDQLDDEHEDYDDECHHIFTDILTTTIGKIQVIDMANRKVLNLPVDSHLEDIERIVMDRAGPGHYTLRALSSGVGDGVPAKGRSHPGWQILDLGVPPRASVMPDKFKRKEDRRSEGANLPMDFNIYEAQARLVAQARETERLILEGGRTEADAIIKRADERADRIVRSAHEDASSMRKSAQEALDRAEARLMEAEEKVREGERVIEHERDHLHKMMADCQADRSRFEAEAREAKMRAELEAKINKISNSGDGLSKRIQNLAAERIIDKKFPQLSPIEQLIERYGDAIAEILSRLGPGLEEPAPASAPMAVQDQQPQSPMPQLTLEEALGEIEKLHERQRANGEAREAEAVELGPGE